MLPTGYLGSDSATLLMFFFSPKVITLSRHPALAKFNLKSYKNKFVDFDLVGVEISE